MSGPVDNGALHLTLDLETFTLGELEDLEEATGMGWEEVVERVERGNPSVKMLTAVLWIVRRRDDPAFTLADARATRITAVKVDEQVPAKKPADHLGKGAKRRPPG